MTQTFETHFLGNFSKDEFEERQEGVNPTKHEIYAMIRYWFEEWRELKLLWIHTHLCLGSSELSQELYIDSRITYLSQFVNADRVHEIGNEVMGGLEG